MDEAAAMHDRVARHTRTLGCCAESGKRLPLAELAKTLTGQRTRELEAENVRVRRAELGVEPNKQ